MLIPPSGALSIALALLVGCGHPTPLMIHATGADSDGIVTKVVDGDTIDVGSQKIRLLGIDTPETVKPMTPVQCGGPEASAFAKQMLTGQHVTLIADPTQADTDRYKRLLRYVRLDDGRDYSIEAARAGMARNYVYAHKPVQEQPQIEAAQAEAQTAHRGLWGHCTV